MDSIAVSNLMADKLGFFSGSEWVCRDSVVHFVGVSGEAVPYKLSNDVFVTVALLICVFIACFVVSRSMYALGLQTKNFFRLRDRNEDFSLKSESEVKDILFVVLLESIVLSLFVFSQVPYMQDIQDLMPNDQWTTAKGQWSMLNGQWSMVNVLLLNAGIMLIYFAYKYTMLRLFNWTFFNSADRQTWMRGYNLISFGKAVTLLPLMMLILYTDLPNTVCISIFLVLLGVFELLVLYKTKQIFFGSIVGLVPAILYFCTLELLPLLFLWVMLVQTNNSLLI